MRELQHLVERLVVTSDKEILDGAMVRGMLELPAPRTEQPFGAFEPLPSLRDLEQRYIDHVLERTGGNKTRAAEILGIAPPPGQRQGVSASR